MTNGWRPIKTAPVNEYVLAFFPEAAEASRIMIGAHLLGEDEPLDFNEWYSQHESASRPFDVEPTHWMPLPGPPE